MNTSPKLTETEVLLIAQQGLTTRIISYDEATGFKARYDGISNDLLGFEGQNISFWTVSYLTSPGFFDQEMFFVKVSDDAGQVLYITGPREYIR